MLSELSTNTINTLAKPLTFMLSQNIGELELTYYYFFSTIAQSAAALFALASIFAIFRIQEINKQLSRSYDAYREWIIRRFGITIASRDRMKSMGINEEPKSWLDKDVLDHLIDFLQKEKNQEKQPYLKALTDYYLHISSHKDFANILKRKLIISTLLLSIIFIDAILTLNFIPYFVANNSKIISYDALILLVFSIIEIIYLVHYILFALAGPKEKYINNPIVNNLN